MKLKNKILLHFFLVFFLFVLNSKFLILNSRAYAAPPGNSADWELTFSDEFNGTTLDKTKWNTRYQFGETVINSELQAFTDDNFILQNGTLNIQARRAPDPGTYYNYKLMNYTAGLINSAEKFHQKYGYFEMKAKLSSGLGPWPGFWLLAQVEQGVNEIDVVERSSEMSSKMNMAVFQGASFDYAAAVKQNLEISVPDLTSQFHTFGVDWQADHLIWYIDGIEKYRITANIPAVSMYPIVSWQVGGSGRSPPPPEIFPNDYFIDYVRAYRKINNQVNTVQILPLGRNFAAPQSITLVSSTMDAEIYYTLDNSIPTQNSNHYTSPFVLANSAILKAKAFKTGFAGSEISSAQFTIAENARALDSNWRALQINGPGTAAAGSFAKQFGASGNNFLIAGAGFNVSSYQDNFYFVYRDLPASGTIEGKISVLDTFAPKAKIGFMVRSGLTPNASDVFIALSPSLGSLFAFRTATTGYTYCVYPQDSHSCEPFNQEAAPIWYRLRRVSETDSNAVFLDYKKNDADPWTNTGKVAVFPGGEAQIGMFVTSRYHNLPNTAIFENVTTSGTIVFPSVTPGGATSTPALPAHCAPLGDIDCSGEVNTSDFAYLISKWGTTDAKANLNDVGVVDSADLKILLNNYVK